MVMNILPALFSSLVVPPLSCTACRSMTLPRAAAAAKVCHGPAALRGGRKDDSRSSSGIYPPGSTSTIYLSTRSRRATNSGLDLTAHTGLPTTSARGVGHGRARAERIACRGRDEGLAELVQDEARHEVDVARRFPPDVDRALRGSVRAEGHPFHGLGPSRVEGHPRRRRVQSESCQLPVVLRLGRDRAQV